VKRCAPSCRASSAPALALEALAVALALVPACKRTSEASLPQPLPAASASVQGAPGPTGSRVVLDMAHDAGACTFGHRGVVLDFGDPSMRATLRAGVASHLVAGAEDEVVEHEGATWLRARSRTITASFYWPTVADGVPDANAYVEARVRGLGAHVVAVSIDGKTVGAWTLVKGEARIVMARASTPVTLAPGGHELALRFVGGSRPTGEILAEIDWAHVGTGEPEEPYAAPTHGDVAVDVMVGDRSLRAVSLRAPGFVHCSGWIPANTTLDVSLATAGGGDAEVEALLVRDRRTPIVLGTARVVGEGATWAPWSVPVTGIEGNGALASIELVATRADNGTRVLLGAPAVVASGTAAGAVVPTARNVVLVVLGSTSAKALAPWGGPHAAPELVREASAATTFEANRASSSLPNAVLASMLTGLPSLLHGLDDGAARLPDGPITVQEACRQGGIATAMFTANPTTAAAFGFARGWDTFVSHDPLEDAPATRVLDDAAAWIDAHKAERFFVVVHARGGHPPWDASPEELRSMPPEGYMGMIEPRRAAEALAKVRAHPARFKDDDRARAWALYDHALDVHDEALGRLFLAIRSAGREDDTAVIVTSDVAASEAPVPFADSDGLDEPLLATPLVIRWPQSSALAGRRVSAPTSPVDLARTIMSTLGLAPPAAFQGDDLAALAQGAVVPAERPLAATRAGRFSARWGPYVLLGTRERETRVCDLSLDPACIADIRATSPLALEAIERFAVDTLLARQANAYPRAPLVMDKPTKAALVRWGGRPGDERETEP
jgi:arylsulfatase A-like enzyme